MSFIEVISSNENDFLGGGELQSVMKIVAWKNESNRFIGEMGYISPAFVSNNNLSIVENDSGSDIYTGIINTDTEKATIKLRTGVKGRLPVHEDTDLIDFGGQQKEELFAISYEGNQGEESKWLQFIWREVKGYDTFWIVYSEGLHTIMPNLLLQVVVLII